MNEGSFESRLIVESLFAVGGLWDDLWTDTDTPSLSFFFCARHTKTHTGTMSDMEDDMEDFMDEILALE